MKIMTALLLGGSAVAGVAWYMHTKSTGGGLAVPGTESMTVYRGFQITTARVSTDIPEPWRWTVADSAGEPIANAVGWSSTGETAIAAGQAWIDLMFPADSTALPPRDPRRPDKPKPGNAAKRKPFPKCDVKKIDGSMDICVYTGPSGTWAYRTTSATGEELGTQPGFATKMAALSAGWAHLAQTFPNQTVVDDPLERFGVLLNPDGSAYPQNQAQLFARISPQVQKAIAQGVPPIGIVLLVFQVIWPAINPYRVRWKNASVEALAGKIVDTTLGGQALNWEEVVQAFW